MGGCALWPGVWLGACRTGRKLPTRAGWEPKNLLSFPLNRHRLSVKILETSDLSLSISGRAGGRSFPFCKCFNPFHTILDNNPNNHKKKGDQFPRNRKGLLGLSPLDFLGCRAEILSPEVSCITCSVPGLRSLSLEGGEGLKGEQKGLGLQGGSGNCSSD